jgi:hypothetical protein
LDAVIARKIFVMGMLDWINKRQSQTAKTEPLAKTPNKRPKIDPEAVKERARKNSPWRFDDGPSRRPVGSK